MVDLDSDLVDVAGNDLVRLCRRGADFVEVAWEVELVEASVEVWVAEALPVGVCPLVGPDQFGVVLCRHLLEGRK